MKENHVPKETTGWWSATYTSANFKQVPTCGQPCYIRTWPTFPQTSVLFWNTPQASYNFIHNNFNTSKGTNFESDRPGIKSRLYQLIALWPWASDWTSLSPSSTSKMGTVFLRRITVWMKWDKVSEEQSLVLAHRKQWIWQLWFLWLF